MPPGVPFLHLLNISEKRRFSKDKKKGTPGINGLIKKTYLPAVLPLDFTLTLNFRTRN